jgi:hypothetical protein
MLLFYLTGQNYATSLEILSNEKIMVLLPSIHKQYLKATKPIKLVKRGQN